MVGRIRDGYRACAEAGTSSRDARRLVETIDHWLSDHIVRLDVSLRDSIATLWRP